MNKRSVVRFPAIFLSTLAVLLALAVECLTAVSPFDSRSLFSRVQTSLVVSVYYLVISGYLIAFLVCYLAFTRKARFEQSLLVHSALFMLCYLMFCWLMSDGLSALDALLFGAGIVSVVASQVLAECFERSSPTAVGQLPES